MRRRLVTGVVWGACALAACGEPGTGPGTLVLEAVAGDRQTGVVGSNLAAPFVVAVRTAAGAPQVGVSVTWRVTAGDGVVVGGGDTDAGGSARAAYTLGTGAGAQSVTASVDGASGSPVTFTATGVAGPAVAIVAAAGSGQRGPAGQPLPAPFVARIADAFGNGVPGEVGWQVTAGGGTIAATSGGTGVGAMFLQSEPDGRSTVYPVLGQPGANAVTAVLQGTFEQVVFTADATVQTLLLTALPIPPNYGVHDMFVRDGIAFVCAWNTGLMLFDVGNGIAGGSPSVPVEISRVETAAAGLGGARAHNAWWFHNPNTAERRYVFVGQEGPGTIGANSSGDIHVVDVSDLRNPVEVAFFHLDGAGTHNFWMDEQNEVLYAAYYNAGVVALDVSGTLVGDLASREIARVRPAGSSTYVWGVQQHNGWAYATDMVNGFYQLDDGSLAVRGGGLNVTERFSSDLWLHGAYAYTGTWGARDTFGNAVKIWTLDPTGLPTLADSIITPDIVTVSDIEVSADGRLLLFSAEGGANAGIHLFGLANDPRAPDALAFALVPQGVHTATIADIAGRRYVFAARNPPDPAMLIYDVTALTP